jgi:hypothetical protein
VAPSVCAEVIPLRSGSNSGLNPLRCYTTYGCEKFICLFWSAGIGWPLALVAWLFGGTTEGLYMEMKMEKKC